MHTTTDAQVEWKSNEKTTPIQSRNQNMQQYVDSDQQGMFLLMSNDPKNVEIFFVNPHESDNNVLWFILSLAANIRYSYVAKINYITPKLNVDG